MFKPKKLRMMYQNSLTLTLLLFIVTPVYCQVHSNGLIQFKESEGVQAFAPELAIAQNTYKGSFSDDYMTFYFFRKKAPGVEIYIPYISNFEAGGWTEPKMLAYYEEGNSYMYQLKTPGSKDLVFLSDLRTKGDSSESPNYNFWYVSDIENDMSEPKELGPQSLIQNYNSQPCITDNKNIYFTSTSSDWSKKISYRMEYKNGSYLEPEIFDPMQKWREKEKTWTIHEFCMSPEEDYLIVSIQKQSEQPDLYISHFEAGVWSFPEKIGYEVNTEEVENFPYITQDGDFLMFTRAFSEFKIISTSVFLKNGH